MAAEPIYGSTNSVDSLDIGQRGGTLNNADDALWVGKVIQQASEPVVTSQPLPQQALGFFDVQGPGRNSYLWQGTIRISSISIWLGVNGIKSNIEQHLHGFKISNTGFYTSFDEAQIRPTRLTDAFGNILTGAAKLTGYNTGPISRLTGNSDYLYLFTLNLSFVSLR